MYLLQMTRCVAFFIVFADLYFQSGRETNLAKIIIILSVI